MKKLLLLLFCLPMLGFGQCVYYDGSDLDGLSIVITNIIINPKTRFYIMYDWVDLKITVSLKNAGEN